MMLDRHVDVPLNFDITSMWISIRLNNIYEESHLQR